MKKHEDSNAVTLACTPAHRHQCPLPRYLNTHHSPCPCCSSSPHASHGLGVLCTLTQVSQPIFAHSACTHLMPRTSAQAHIVPNSMFGFRRERRAWSLGGGSWSTSDKSKGAAVRGWIWGMEWGGQASALQRSTA